MEMPSGCDLQPQQCRRIRRIRTFVRSRLAGLVLVVGAFGAGCATTPVAGTLYRDTAQGFEVRLPDAPWSVHPLPGAKLSLRNLDRGAAMALLTECKAPEVGELRGVARHLYFGLQDKQVQAQEPVDLQGVPGLQTRLSATLDGRPVEVEGITLRHAGCLLDFVYVAPPAAFPGGRGEFRAFVGSWRPLTGP
jgi:hypothetical protein